MPQSKKDLRKAKVKAQEKAGTRPEIVNGKPAKPPQVHAKCTKCLRDFTVTKTNIQLTEHVNSKHPTETFATCFPDL